MKKTLSLFLVFCMLLTVYTPTAAFAEVSESNLALHKDYEISQQFRTFGRDTNWTWDENAPILYPDEYGSLTDGETFGKWTDYTDWIWAGFHSSAPEYGELGYSYFTISLEGTHTVSRVELCTLKDTSVGISLPEQVELYYSADGVNYFPGGSFAVDAGSAPEGVNTLTFESGRATRYLQVRFSMEKWAFVSEVEIYGVPGGRIDDLVIPLESAEPSDPADFTYEITDGCVTITGYRGAGGNITIPSTIEGCKVTEIGTSAFYYNQSLTNVTIPDGVVSIGDGAFCNCTALRQIHIPASVTRMYDTTFMECASALLVTVDENNPVYRSGGNCIIETAANKVIFGCSNSEIPEGVTHLGAYSFCGQSALTQITIPDSVVVIEAAAFSGCTSLRSVALSDRLECIGISAFKDCALESIRIPDSVTTIEEGAFRVCELESVFVSASVTTLALDAFDGNPITSFVVDEDNKVYYSEENCLIETETNRLVRGYSTQTIPQSVKIIGKAAITNKQLRRIVIPENVTTIESKAFSASGITSILIPESVTVMGEDAFSYCRNLTDVYCVAKTKPDGWSESWVRDVREPFVEHKHKTVHWGFEACLHEDTETTSRNSTCTSNGYTLTVCNICCEKLVDEIYPMDEHSFDSAGYCMVCGYYVAPPEPELFQYEITDGTVTITKCLVQETDMVIPSEIEGYPVTRIGYEAFGYCEYIKTITLPEGITCIEDWAFAACLSLESIEIPDTVTEIGEYAFNSCYSLKSVVIPYGVTRIQPVTFMSCISLESVEIPDSVTSIGFQAFVECSALESIMIPSSVECIEFESFFGCTSLQSIEIPKNTQLEENIFGGCTALTDIYCEAMFQPDDWAEGWLGDCTAAVHWNGGAPILPEATDLVIEIVYEHATVFGYCGDGGELVIPSEYKGYPVTEISGGAFKNCTTLTSVVIPENITTIRGEVFMGCTSLTKVTLPDTVESIMNYAFARCTSLTEINFPESLTRIGEYAFQKCSSLTSIELPAGVTRVDKTAFYSCTSLSSIVVAEGNTVYDSEGNCLIETESGNLLQGCKNSVIPKGVTSIGEDAFYGCESLTGVTIPASVTSIGDRAFYGCVALNSVEIPNNVTSVGWNVFGWSDDFEEVALDIYCEAESQPESWSVAWVSNADITVHWGAEMTVSVTYGDVNGDGIISGRDITRLLRYLADRDPQTGETDVEIALGADANGDGKISGTDITRLLRYLADRDPMTGESSVVLGPRA